MNMQMYSISTNSWTTDLAPLPRTRKMFDIAVFAGKIYVFSGLTHDFDSYAYEQDVFIYDTHADSWTVPFGQTFTVSKYLGC